MGLPTLFKKGSLRPGMGESQSTLDSLVPIDYIVAWFRDHTNYAMSNSDRFVIMQSTTGTGKSTAFPAELFLRLYKDENIAITQPRVITTIDIPNTIVKVPVYSSLELGKNVSYLTSEYKNNMSEKGLCFMTIGILLMQVQNSDPYIFAKKYKVIIIDEAHERSIDTDLALFYLKKLCNHVGVRNMPFVVCASGTLDVQKYAEYFNTTTIFNVVGDSYPIENRFLKYDTSNLLESIVNTVATIHKQEKEFSKKDIIVFVPTNKMIRQVQEATRKIKELLPIGMDSRSMKKVAKDYNNVFDDNRLRKLIIGTNAIETGITLANAVHCIDTGLVNSAEFNPVEDALVLIGKPVTQAMAMQRRGRVGRIQEGTFHALYSKDTYDQLHETVKPSIFTSDLSLHVLQMCCNGIDPLSIDTLDSPMNISISKALHKLYRLRLIDSERKPVEIAKSIVKIKMMTLESILLVLQNPDLIDVACYLSYGKMGLSQFFTVPKKIKKLLSCEWLEFMVLFQMFKESANMRKFCKDWNLDYDGMISFAKLRAETMRDFNETFEIRFYQEETLTDLINISDREAIKKIKQYKQAFANCYFLNAIICTEPNKFGDVYYNCSANVGDIVLYDSLVIKNINGVITKTVQNGVTNISHGVAIGCLYR
jgi:HrpA-like RNA helicase